jgi:hypothetical protein
VSAAACWRGQAGGPAECETGAAADPQAVSVIAASASVWQARRPVLGGLGIRCLTGEPAGPSPAWRRIVRP